MYDKEDNVVAKSKEVLGNNDLTLAEMREGYASLAKKYETLLSDLKFLTKISDRLQHKMNNINESLMQKTISLEKAQEIIMDQNDQLKVSKLNLEEKVLERTDELKKAYDDLLASSQELDTFVYRASHDIKGPIARLIGLCYLGIMESKDETALGYFEMLSKTANSMNNVLARLLSVNNLKHAQVKYTRVNAVSIIKKSLDSLSLIDGFKSLGFELRMPEIAIIETDTEIFSILLQSVLENAIKSCLHRDTENSTVKLAADVSDDKFILGISYRGAEIPAEYTAQIFNMFYRTTNHEDVSGMELYTASLAAGKLQGGIKLVSSTHELTVFEFWAPVNKPKETIDDNQKRFLLDEG